MPDDVIHLTPQELTAFGLGKLSERAAAKIAAHLESCSACRKAASAVPPDTFLDKLRAAGRDGASFSPGLAQPKSAPSSAGRPAIRVVPCPDVPSELASHPKYLILRELNRGGMGVVYQARQTMMNRQVVIKVISRSLLDRPDSLERFRREIQAAAQLSHPNIVTAYDAEQAGELHMLVMEFVPGQSLAEVLEKKGPLPIAHACYYIRQAALGLQHAHERGMVHRDIKPGNLMLTPNRQIKILDFGLAKVISERDKSKGLTSSDACMGTAEYIAPEQAKNAGKADIRADLYSLGCTLYCLLAGRPPFREDTWMNTVLAHIQKEPQPLTELRQDVPDRLWRVVARLLAKEPAQRYQKPSEVVQAMALFVKLKTKPAANVSSPVRGTEISADTNEIKKAPQEVPGKTPPKDAPAKEAASSFTDLINTGTDSQKIVRVNAPAKPPVVLRRKRFKALAAVASVFLALILMSGIIIYLKTRERTIVIEVNEPKPEVYVDGEIVTVSWHDGGKKAEIRVKPGTHEVEVRKDGFSMVGPKLTFNDGDREVFTATLLPNKPSPPPDMREQGKVEKKDKAQSPSSDEDWIREVRTLPAEQQWKAVADKLKKLNTEFDGTVKPTIDNGVVTGLEFVTDQVTYISPLRALSGMKFLFCQGSAPGKGKLADLSRLKGIPLTTLDCGNNPRLSDLSPLTGMSLTSLGIEYTQVSDLSPLEGMPLTTLWCGNGTRISDLSPLKGMRLKRITLWHQTVSDLSPLKGIPLEELYCDNPQVTDLSPLKDMPLRILNCDFRPERDTEILRSIKTLEKINGKPVAEVLLIAQPPRPEAKKELPLSRTYKDYQGDWRIEGDELVQAAPVNAYMIFGDFNWKDYDFTVKVKQMGDIEKGGIYQLYRAMSRGWVQYGIGSIGVQDVHDAVSSVELGCSGHLYQRPGKLRKNHWHTMLVRVRGEKHQCFIDREMDFEYRDQRNVRGAVGLQTEQTAARFRDILVRDPDGNVLFAGLPKLPDNPRIVATESISDTQLHCLEGHSAPVLPRHECCSLTP